MTEKQKPKAERRLSLHPLNPDEAVADLLKVKPEADKKPEGKTKRQSKRR